MVLCQTNAGCFEYINKSKSKHKSVLFTFLPGANTNINIGSSDSEIKSSHI